MRYPLLERLLFSWFNIIFFFNIRLLSLLSREMVLGMKQSTLDPVRMMHLAIHLSAVVIVAAYSAALISFLAVKTFVMPFKTMDGLLKDGTYRFGVVGDSADYSFFQVL